MNHLQSGGHIDHIDHDCVSCMWRNILTTLIIDCVLQDGGWWTSVRGWVGWVWLSIYCSASWWHTMCLMFSGSVWSTWGVWGRAPQLRPPSAAWIRAFEPNCHHFQSGCGHQFSSCLTCSCSSSCSPARGPTLVPSVTASCPCVSPFSSAGVMLRENRPITTAQQWSTRSWTDGTTAGDGATREQICFSMGCHFLYDSVNKQRPELPTVMLALRPMCESLDHSRQCWLSSPLLLCPSAAVLSFVVGLWSY